MVPGTPRSARRRTRPAPSADGRRHALGFPRGRVRNTQRKLPTKTPGAVGVLGLSTRRSGSGLLRTIPSSPAARNPLPRYSLFRAYLSHIAGQGSSLLRRRWLRVRCAPACNKERANAVIQPNSCVVTGNHPSTVSQVRNDNGARTHRDPYTGLRYAHLRVPGLRSFGNLGGAFGGVAAEPTTRPLRALAASLERRAAETPRLGEIAMNQIMRELVR